MNAHTEMPTMLDHLTPAQIRGARAMLNWSMVDLSMAARVSVSTIKRIEDGSGESGSERILALIQDEGSAMVVR